MASNYLTIPEAAALLRVAERTLYTLCRQGKFPAMKVGNQWRVDREVLREWGRIGGGPPSMKQDAAGGNDDPFI